MKNTDKNANLHITAKIQNLDNLIDFTEKFMQKNGFDNKSIMQISIVAEEIFTNICNYGQLADDDIIKIDARMECDSKCVICFADGGIAFNPLFQKEPDTHLPLNRRKEGGLGIYMIKQLTSKVNYKYENGMNILTIEKQKTEA